MRIKLLTVIMTLFLAPNLAWAEDQLVIGFGPSLNGGTNPKALFLGDAHTWGEFSLISRCALLFEGETNGWCSVVAAVHIETPSGILVSMGVGPAWVIHTDDRISSNLNANIHAMVGAIQSGYAGGACYDHISNAGAVPPNLGRDQAYACLALFL
jgi:hypothetical protein